MDQSLSTWLSTLEPGAPVNEPQIMPITPPAWSLYTQCVSLLSKQQLSLAGSDFPQEILNNLKDEWVKLKIWGDGYNGRQIEALFDQFLELKETIISILLRIADLLAHS